MFSSGSNNNNYNNNNNNNRSHYHIPDRDGRVQQSKAHRFLSPSTRHFPHFQNLGHRRFPRIFQTSSDKKET